MSEDTTTTEVPESKLDSTLRKVQGLLAKAEHPNTGPAEAEAFRAKAEELMQRYRIEEHMLIKSGSGEMKPVLKTWGVCESNSVFYNTLYTLMSICARHAGVKMTYKWGPDPDNGGKHSLLAQLVGYESDVRYAIMLYVSLHMTFSARMEPKYDPNLSDADNVYALRGAGVERWRIAQIMGWAPEGLQDPAIAKESARVTKVYKQACEARGEDPLLVGRGNSVKAYKESYTDAFVTTINNRLYRMQMEAGVNNAGELVLADRKTRVQEAFYEFFPDLKPQPYTGATTGQGKGRRRSYAMPKRKYSPAGDIAGTRAANEADLTGRAGRQSPRGIND